MKGRKWSSLALELLVVVVGIFLGLQADSWYQSRSEQRELETYLQALSEELGTSAWMRGNYVQWHRRVIDGLKLATDSLDGAQLTPDETEQAFFGLTHLSNPPTSPQRYAVLAAMQAAGMLRLIDDTKLRQMLGELLTGIDTERSEYDRFMGSIDAPAFSAKLVRYGLAQNDEVEIIAVDWEAARQDAAFRQRILQGIGAYGYLLGYHEAYETISRDALALLSEAGIEPSGNWLEENQEKFSN